MTILNFNASFPGCFNIIFPLFFSPQENRPRPRIVWDHRSWIAHRPAQIGFKTDSCRSR